MYEYTSTGTTLRVHFIQHLPITVDRVGNIFGAKTSLKKIRPAARTSTKSVFRENIKTNSEHDSESDQRQEDDCRNKQAFKRAFFVAVASSEPVATHAHVAVHCVVAVALETRRRRAFVDVRLAAASGESSCAVASVAADRVVADAVVVTHIRNVAFVDVRLALRTCVARRADA